MLLCSSVIISAMGCFIGFPFFGLKTSAYAFTDRKSVKTL